VASTTTQEQRDCLQAGTGLEKYSLHRCLKSEKPLGEYPAAAMEKKA
jgi:hypothetical protein